MNDVSSISWTSLTLLYWTICSSHCLSLTNIESPLCASNHVYIVHILNITMLDDIESTSWRHRLPLLTLFTSFTSSTPQCYTISNQHRVNIALLLITLLTSFTSSTSTCFTIYWLIDFIVFTPYRQYFCHILAAIFNDVESTSCRHVYMRCFCFVSWHCVASFDIKNTSFLLFILQ